MAFGIGGRITPFGTGRRIIRIVEGKSGALVDVGAGTIEGDAEELGAGGIRAAVAAGG
jgi:hypothetical protein